MAILYGWIPPRSRKQPKRNAKFIPSTQSPAVASRLHEAQALRAAYPSLGDSVGNATKSLGVKYDDPDMADREAAAREVKHTVAPICNKGGYQLITNEADIKTAGRKV